MLDFIWALIPGGPALYAIGVAVIAVVWGFVHGGTKKKQGIELGKEQAENRALKKDIRDANRIEAAADAARVNAAGLSAADRIAARGRLRSTENDLP